MDAPTENDPALALYLRAQSEDQAAVQLVSLFRLQAEPVIEQILRAKRSATIHSELEVEDVTSAAREQLMRQLALLRDGQREPIRDLRGYVASITYSAWAEMLRGRYPQRAMLFNRLRYLLEDRTTQKGFAEKWKQNPAMVTSFADGSKISFEQAIVANATGFQVQSRGMSRGCA